MSVFRPTKFDKKKAELIHSALNEGLSLADAAHLAGLDPRSVSVWMALGQKDGARQPFKRFATSAAQAHARFLWATLRAIRAGHDEKGALRAVLAKLRPRQFGDRVRVQVEDELRAFLDRLQVAMSSDVYEQVLLIAAGELGSAADKDGEPSLQ